MLTVPAERSRDALAQSDARVVTNLLPGARDVERAALGVEIDAAPVNRRLDPERRAGGLADRAREPEWPDRQMNARRAHAADLRDCRDQLVQRRHFSTRQDVCAICRGR